MNRDRIMSLVYHGSPLNCELDDRISIEFSPSELLSLTIHFTAAAMKADTFSTQTEMREYREAFNRAHVMWEKYKGGIK